MSEPSSQKILDDLKTLRDEIKVKIHLAGMEAKDAWANLEAQARDVERDLVATARKTGQDARVQANKIKASLEKLREQIAGRS